MEDEFFYADGQTVGLDEAKSRFSELRERAWELYVGQVTYTTGGTYYYKVSVCYKIMTSNS